MKQRSLDGVKRNPGMLPITNNPDATKWTKFDWIEFEHPTKFAWSKFERPKVGLKGELQDVIRNDGPMGRIHGCIL